MGERDSAFLRRAIDLAENGANDATPNPRVGCVIVKNGEVVAEGWHHRVGRAARRIRRACENRRRGGGVRGLFESRTVRASRAHAALRRGVDSRRSEARRRVDARSGSARARARNGAVARGGNRCGDGFRRRCLAAERGIRQPPFAPPSVDETQNRRHARRQKRARVRVEPMDYRPRRAIGRAPLAGAIVRRYDRSRHRSNRQSAFERARSRREAATAQNLSRPRRRRRAPNGVFSPPTKR